MKKDPYAPIREQMTEQPRYWRSVEQRDGNDTLKEMMESEFPNGVTTPEGFNRRDALKIGGAAMALGTLPGCDKLSGLQVRRPQEEILPFVKQPEQVVPGLRMYYSTAMQRSEGAIGLIVEANQGRPTKIEGNPTHPGSLGASDIWAQTEVLRLYDPERARSPLQAGAASTWEKFDAAFKDLAAKFAGTQGQGLAIVVEDEGNGFDYRKLPDPTAAENLTRIGGRGVFLMFRLCDSVRYRRNGCQVELGFNL